MGSIKTQHEKGKNMTFFRQITLILSIFLLTILTTVLVLNFISANQSVQERLFEDAKNTATSLSLSLGSANGDLPMMSVIINADFDSGNYSLISLVDVDNHVLYERKSEVVQPDVPQWFLNIIDIKAPIASSNVSAGWNQVGVLYVQSNTSYACTHLYTMTINLLISFTIIAVFGLIILNILLATILKPLKQVQLQAEAVTKNEFIIQENIPTTKEFKEVVLGMNNMVSKVKTMFDKANKELKRQKELEYIDPVTKLKNRNYLIDKLPQYLKEDAIFKDGIEMMISLSGVIEANKMIGRERVDELFIEMAEIFKTEVSIHDNAIISRMNGTEFSILIPNYPEDKALDLAGSICGVVTKSIRSYALDTNVTFVSIGIYQYNHKQTVTEVLSLCDHALAQAKIKTSHIYFDKAQTMMEIMAKDTWRDVIKEVIEARRFSFVWWSVVDTKKKAIVHNALSITMKTQDDTIYSYGQFMAPAYQVGLSSKIYQMVVDMTFQLPDIVPHQKTYALRLSYEYLSEKETYLKISQVLSRYALHLPFKLIVEIPDKLVQEDFEHIKEYKKLFEKYDVEVGIFEFIAESGDYQYLQEIRPCYIKAEANYFLSQSEQSLLALKRITDTLDITLIATSVMDMQTLQKLEQKDIYVVQGRVSEIIL